MCSICFLIFNIMLISVESPCNFGCVLKLVLAYKWNIFFINLILHSIVHNPLTVSTTALQKKEVSHVYRLLPVTFLCWFQVFAVIP